MSFRKTLLVASMLGAALLGGCLHPPKNSGVAVVGGKVWVYDPSFAVNIQLIKDDITRTPQGFLHVQTTLQNTNHEDWNCQYRFVWFDANGMEQTHAPTILRPCVLHGMQTTVLEGVSPLQGTASFRLELRPGRY